MSQLSIEMKNCWGIRFMRHEFDFGENEDNRAYAIYASNGTMKTSFAKTFEALSNGKKPKEERYGRSASCKVLFEGSPISSEEIYVLKSETGLIGSEDAISNILVNPKYRDRYNELNKNIIEEKNKLTRALNKQSRIKQEDIEIRITQDLGKDDFAECISHLMSEEPILALSKFPYSIIFDEKALEVVKSPEFLSNAKEFSARYQELFQRDNSIYKKGIFNPTKAGIAYKALNAQGFFKAQHRVHLRGDNESISGEAFEEKLKEINARLDGDEQLKEIRTRLEKNAQTRALTNLIEGLSSSDIEYLIDNLKPKNRKQFRKNLWTYYIHECPEAKSYDKIYQENVRDLRNIEKDAEEIANIWNDIVKLYKDRFVDMPFIPIVANHSEAALGKESAKVKFQFEDGEDTGTFAIGEKEMSTLSYGEQRALNLLYFIFEVEERKRNQQRTLFIIDDIADSFDYKNKQAIILYLKDLSEIDYFYLIMLTHNFDFYRSLNNTFVQYRKCLTVRIDKDEVFLDEARGIKNVFIKVWKKDIFKDDSILYATVPFTRNLLEYTKEKDDKDFLRLTSLMHWKEDTDTITVKDYVDVYNRFFGKDKFPDRDLKKPMIDILFDQADKICKQDSLGSLSLADKVVLSIAIRIKVEQFMIDRIRILLCNNNYWCTLENQFAKLYKQLKELDPSLEERSVLDKISVTVSSNIHLNSFMYEPILDLSLEHLVKLYKEVVEMEA